MFLCMYMHLTIIRKLAVEVRFEVCNWDGHQIGLEEILQLLVISLHIVSKEGRHQSRHKPFVQNSVIGSHRNADHDTLGAGAKETL